MLFHSPIAQYQDSQYRERGFSDEIELNLKGLSR